MDMTMPKLAVLQTSASSTPSSNAKSDSSIGSGGFQKVLVQQIDNNKPDSKPQPPLFANVAALIGGDDAVASTDPTHAAMDLANLLSFIDELIDKLSGDNETDFSNEDELKEELTALNDQLNALLAMLGVPIATFMKQVTPLNEESDDAATMMPQTSAEQLKSNLQDGLLQLQAVLAQSGLKSSAGQAPLQLVAQEVESIANALAELTKPAEKQTETSKSTTPDWLTAIASNEQKDTAKQLQRLSQLTMNTVQQGVGAQEIQMTDVEATQQQATQMIDPDNNIPLPMGLLQSGNLKDLTPQISSQPAPTAYVLAEDFADTMNGLLVQKLNIQTLNGNSEAKLMLMPEHLGQVDVRISMQNGILTAVFHTDTSAAKDMLDNQMAQLRASLQAQGLNVDKLQVTQTQPSLQFGGQPFSQQNSGQPFSRGQQGFNGGQHTAESFEAELDEQAAIQGLGYGRAINEIA